MAKYENSITGDFNKVVNTLHHDIMESAMSMNLVDETFHQFEDTKVALKVYDKYFMRNNSRASLSLTVVGRDEDIYITAIGAGGGQGIIFNFSLGAEQELVDMVQESIVTMLSRDHFEE